MSYFWTYIKALDLLIQLCNRYTISARRFSPEKCCGQTLGLIFKRVDKQNNKKEVLWSPILQNLNGRSILMVSRRKFNLFRKLWSKTQNGDKNIIYPLFLTGVLFGYCSSCGFSSSFGGLGGFYEFARSPRCKLGPATTRRGMLVTNG